MPSLQTALVSKSLERFFKTDSVFTSIEHFYFTPFSSIEMENLLLTDKKGDTFMFVGQLYLQIADLNLVKNEIKLDLVELNNGKLHLRHYKKEQFVNIRFLLDHFLNTDTGTAIDFAVLSKSIQIHNFDFIWQDENVNSGIIGVDFDDIHVQKLYAEFSDFEMHNVNISSQVDQISLFEKSGFTLDTLETSFIMNSDSMAFGGLKIITPNSKIYGNYCMQHGNFNYYSNYINQVTMKGSIHNILLDMKDVIYFSDNLIGFNEIVYGKGKYVGTVADFVASDLDLSFRKHSVIRGSARMKGIPNIDSTYMDFELVNAELNPSDVDALLLEVFSDNLKIDLPYYVINFGTARTNGNFKGYIDNFKSDIKINGKNGFLNASYSMKKRKDQEHYYSGTLISKKLNLGALFQKESIGYITSKVEFEGSSFKKSSLNVDLRANIISLGLKEYDYSKTIILGEFKNEIFLGQVLMDDPNCKFNFLGEIDLTKKEPRLVFEAEIDTLFPNKINLLNRDSTAFISAKIKVDSKGDGVENFAGKIEIENFIYKEKEKTIDIPDFKFQAFQINERRQIEFKSTIGKGMLAGSYDIPKIRVYFENMVKRSLPALVESVEVDSTPGDFTFSFELYDLNPIMEIFHPSIELDSNLFFSGLFDGPEEKIDLNLTTAGFKYSGIEVDSLQFKFKYQNSSILSNINIVTLALHKDIKYRDVSFEGFGTKDSIVVKVSNDNNSKPKFKSNISFTGALLSPTSVKLIFDSSYVVLADSVWVLNSENLVEWDSSRWAFKNFNLVSNLKKINLSGAISKDTSDQLDIFISGLNLGNFAKIAEVKEAQLKGNVTGVISLAKLYYRPDISSTIYVNDLYANNEYVGSGPLYSSWNSDLERFDVNFDLFRPADSAFIDTIRSLKFYGHYYPQVEDTSFQLKLLTDGFKIKAIEPIVKEYLDNISGELVGEIDLSGSFSNPIINGKIRLDSTSFRIVYLNTNYYFNNQYLIFEDDWFGYNDLLFQDENGSEAHSIGTVNHSNWKNFDYDLYVKANNFLCLNTNAKQNELFYGKAFISGDVNIAGYEDHLNIEMDARTQNNSKLFVPLYAADEVSSNHFIHFVNVETDSEEDHLKKHNTDLSGIDMKFNFDIDPSTEIQLIFDETSGEKLTAQGGGKIKMLINPEKDFEMFGNYEIRNGDYFFNFENIISKRFTIQQGGKIDFNGDPLNARTDIVAQYKVKTGLQEILGDSAYSQKVENLCLMHLTDHLSDPNISFDIKVLNVDAEIESRVRNQMPTQEDVNMQVFSLMLFNKYSPPENSLSGSGFAGTTTSELLTSQINSWLGKMDNRVVKVGVSELKQDNVEVQLSKEMLNNRLVFESNLGVDNSQTNTNQGESEQLVGDFKLEYMVRKDGKVRAKVFNRSETYRIEDQGNSASQTQGIGIFFQEEFEFYGQLLKRYFNNPVRKKERKEKKDAKIK